MKWCLDTSAFIEPWVRLYPPDVMGPVWEFMSKLAEDHVIAAPEEVLLELERQKDDLYAWAKNQTGLFLPPDRAVVEKMTEIVNAHPGLVKVNSTKSAGDPWVIAQAEMNNVPVVQYETRSKRALADTAPKIPDVCDKRKIKCVTLVEMLRAEGFKL